MTSEAQPGTGSELQYSYRPSLMGATWSFRLSDRGLHWSAGQQSGLIGFGQITRVRLSFRPVTMQSQRFVAEIWSSDMPRLNIASTTVKSMFEQERLGASYRAFVTELHRRLAVAGSQAAFEGGINRLLFWARVVVFVVTALALAGIAVRTLQTGALIGAAGIGLFLAVFIWRVGNTLRRNRPVRYRPDAIPPDLLPDG